MVDRARSVLGGHDDHHPWHEDISTTVIVQILA